MIDGNPYESPAAQLPTATAVRPDQNRQRSTDVDGSVVRYAQLGLRLIGVMFVVEGIGGMIGSIAYAVMQATALQQAGYSSLNDAYAFGWFAASAASFVAGCYFVIDGHWVLERIFLPPTPASEVDVGVPQSDSSDE